MNDNSEGDIFFDAIGDQAQIEAIKGNTTNGINRENLNGNKNFIQESPEWLKLPKIPSANNHKLEDLNDHSKTNVSQSLEAIDTSKNPTVNPLRRSSVPIGRQGFFAQLHKKQIVEAEFGRENVKTNNKSESVFNNLICLQLIDDIANQAAASNAKKSKTISPIWVAKFSPNNKLLATGGSDGILRIFRLTDEDDWYSEHSESNFQILDPSYTSLTKHKFDIIDMSWYKDSKLLLTSSVDKTVILWNVEKHEPVKVFEHSDIVSCISFHPLIDEFFASGCFDKIIRLWDINEVKVIDWVQANDIITALTFSPDQSHLLVGFYKGTVKIYKADQGKLKFMMEITCKNKFTWGKVNKVGKKVTSIIFTEDYEFLVMTNDSRMRLIDFKNYETKVKYKGHSSGKYHIQPSYSYEKELILCGSEDEKVYIWNKAIQQASTVNPMYNRQKKNRNTSYECFKPFHKANTTSAVWLPFPILKKYKEKILAQWKDIYVDNLMILFSSDSKIKVVGNLIELNQIPKDK